MGKGPGVGVFSERKIRHRKGLGDKEIAPRARNAQRGLRMAERAGGSFFGRVRNGIILRRRDYFLILIGQEKQAREQRGKEVGTIVRRVLIIIVRCICRPLLPSLFRKFLEVIRVKQFPERRTEDPLCVKNWKTESISVTKLVGLFINTDTAADAFSDDEERKEGFSDHIKVLSEAAKSDVHILKGLGKHIYRDAIMTVILKELDSCLRESLIVAAVELDTSFVDDHLAVLYHMDADILPGIQTEGTGNGNVGPDRILSFPIAAVQNPVSEAAGESAAEADNDRFFPGLFGEIGGISSLAGAGDAKVYIQLEGVPWMASTAQEEPKKGYPENIFHIEDLNF